MSFLVNDELGQRLIALGLINSDGEWLGGGAGGGISVVTVDPGSPQSGDVWILAEGTTPTATLTLKVQVGVTTVEVPLVTY